MLIIGCDFHPGFQQVAIFDNLTGEMEEKRLAHRQEAEAFYRSLAGQPVRVGMEACGMTPQVEMHQYLTFSRVDNPISCPPSSPRLEITNVL